MSSNAGVWIDHREAIIVSLTENGSKTLDIHSEVDKHLERRSDSPLNGRFESRQVPADNRRQRALTPHLNVYYDQVIKALRDFDQLILFGPGEAKSELHKRMAKTQMHLRVMAIEVEDRMTKSQIEAKVLGYFRSHYSNRASI